MTPRASPRLEERAKQAGFVLLGALALWPGVGASLALALGVAFGLTLGNPFPVASKTWATRLLQASVIALGAGMDLWVVARVGARGVGYTLAGITLTLLLAAALGRALRVSSGVTPLIGVGTAICGGSAIAAVGPVLRSKPEDLSTALAVVFVLNAVALVVFPPLGHALGLSQEQFGLWSALAIHDTSSVVGAASQFGPRALEVATTVKLARALWILPLALLAPRLWPSASGEASPQRPRPARPWFILGFIAAAALASFVPALKEPGALLAQVGRHGLVLALFLVGAGMTREALRRLGLRPLAHAVLLWLLVATGTLGAIASGVIAL